MNIDQSNVNALIEQGRACEARGDWDGAAGAYQAALEQLAVNDPLRGELQLIVASVQRQKQIAEEQARLLARALANVAQHQWRDAAECYRALLAQSPQSAHAGDWLATLRRCEDENRLLTMFEESNAAIQRGEIAAARELLRALIHLAPNYERNGVRASTLLERTFASRFSLLSPLPLIGLGFSTCALIGMISFVTYIVGQNIFAPTPTPVTVVVSISPTPTLIPVAPEFPTITPSRTAAPNTPTTTPIPPTRTPTVNAPTGRIAFTSERDGNSEIYVMNVDGSAPQRISNHPNSDWYPSWSFDGRMIAFQSNRDGNIEIYVMNADGTNQRNLSRNSADDYFPAWSPDGRQITFTSKRDSRTRLYTMNSDGSNQRAIPANHSGEDEHSVFSPDGRLLAFQSNRNGKWQIYLMNTDGSNARRLTNNSANDVFPVWSPDGRAIAFQSDRNGHPEIYVMNMDGSNQRRLTTHSAENRDLVWSPDGAFMVFSSERDGNCQIYVMGSDGRDPRRLTFTNGYDCIPAWTR